jgi:hypothetical protein
MTRDELKAEKAAVVEQMTALWRGGSYETLFALHHEYRRILDAESDLWWSENAMTVAPPEEEEEESVEDDEWPLENYEWPFGDNDYPISDEEWELIEEQNEIENGEKT